MHKQYRTRRWTRRQALWLLAGGVGSVGLHSCVSSSTTPLSSKPSNLKTATFGINPWIGQAPLHIAIAKGFFEEEGLDLSARAFGTNLESIPAFMSGRLEGCTAMPTSEAVTMASEGGDFRIVGVMDLSSGGDAILARNSIRDIRSFQGKRIAVQRGGLGHFFLLQVLEEEGLTENDITIIDTDPEVAATAYQAGNVEIAYTYSPFLEKANAAQPDGRIIYDTSKKPTAITDLNLVSTEFAETYPDAVQGFLKGIFKAQEFLETNPDESYEIVAEPLGITAQEVGEQLKGVRLPDLQTHLEMFNDAQSNLSLLSSLTSMAEFLKNQGQIETIPDLSKLIAPQFLQDI